MRWTKKKASTAAMIRKAPSDSSRFISDDEAGIAQRLHRGGAHARRPVIGHAVSSAMLMPAMPSCKPRPQAVMDMEDAQRLAAILPPARKAG